MSDVGEMPETQPRKKPVLVISLSLALAFAGGAGGYYAARSGLVPDLGPGSDTAAVPETAPTTGHDRIGLPTDLADIEFVALEPIMISLGQNGELRNLRFRAQIEVTSSRRKEVEKLKPRIIDVLNSYLRALEPDDLARPSALIRLRAHMVRRLRIVAGEDAVRDVLIMEFVLS